VGGEVWGFLWIMLALKIPLAMLLYIVWYAIKAVPEPAPGDDRDGGIGDPRHPRSPGPPTPRRRGPHGDPVIPPPPRTRTPATSREREPARPVR
jgi:hypothetical protein